MQITRSQLRAVIKEAAEKIKAEQEEKSQVDAIREMVRQVVKEVWAEEADEAVVDTIDEKKNGASKGAKKPFTKKPGTSGKSNPGFSTKPVKKKH